MCRVASAKSNDVHSNSYGVVAKIGTINNGYCKTVNPCRYPINSVHLTALHHSQAVPVSAGAEFVLR